MQAASGGNLQMQAQFFDGFSTFWRKFATTLLAVFVVSGFTLGVYAASMADTRLLDIMRTAACRPVSIVGLLAVAILPFFLSFLIVYSGHPVFLLPICFGKAFSWSYCSYLTVCAYGSAGWLIHFFLMFTDSALLSVLFWFSLRYITGKRPAILRDAAVCLVLAVTVAFVDLGYISPYLMMLTA